MPVLRLLLPGAGTKARKAKMSREEMPKDQPQVSKKPYQAPVLREYGTLMNLTRTSAQLGGIADTRGPAMDIKTH